MLPFKIYTYISNINVANMKTLPPIQISRTYQRPIDQVWEIVTDQKYLSQWLMPGNFEAKKGKQFRFDCPPDENECSDFVNGEVLEVEAPKRIQFTWRTASLAYETIVTFLLDQTEEGVNFQILHEGFAEASIEECDKHLTGWKYHQDLINQLNHEQIPN